MFNLFAVGSLSVLCSIDLGDNWSAPAITSFCQVLFLNLVAPYFFVCVFYPIHSGVPVLLLFLGEPKPCSLGCPNLRQPHQHVSRDWSTKQVKPDLLWWGGTGDLVPPHRGAVRSGGYQIIKAQICQCSCQPAQASPLGHSGQGRCMQWIGFTVWWPQNCSVGAVWQKQVAVLLWAASPPIRHARPQACIHMGKLKQSLPHGISPDNDFLLAMFFIQVQPSMWEAVGSGNHKTAVAMVEAADTLLFGRG